MVAVRRFVSRKGKRWFSGFLSCFAGKSAIKIEDATVKSSVVPVETPEFTHRRGQGELANQQLELDVEVPLNSSSQAGEAGLEVSRPLRKVSSLRKVTGVTLRTCFNSLPFPDCLTGLVPLLFKDNQRIVQEHAARAIAELSTLQARQRQIAIFPNCIAGLGRLLSKKHGTRTREYAALALGNVGASQDIQAFVQRIAERPDALYHFVKALVPVLFRDDDPILQDQACTALTDLSSVRISMEEIGAATQSVAGFVRMLPKTYNQYGQECAALTLSNLALSTDTTGRIVNCPGALRILIRLLVDSGHRYALQENVTMTLRNLVCARENALSIMESPHFSNLLNGLTDILFRPDDDTNSVRMQEMAAETLMNLFVAKEIIEKMDEFPTSLLAGLVYCLMKDRGRSAEYAAMALGNLALRPENTLNIIYTPGALRSLLRLLLMFDNPGGQKEAVFTILNLSHGDDKVKIQIAEYMTSLESLIKLLLKNKRILGEEVEGPASDSTLQECAVDVLCNLTCVEQNSIKIAKFPGALLGLVTLFLDNSNPVLQGKVALVLSNLAIKPANKVILSDFPNVLAGLVRCLFADETPRLQQYAAQALSRLTMLEATQLTILTEQPKILEGFVLLLSKHDAPVVQESAARGLRYLGQAKENRVKMLEYPGALAGLKSVIRKDDRTVLQETALICIANLAIEDKTKIPILEFPEMLTDIVHLISKGTTPNVKGLSAFVLGSLARNSCWIQLKLVSFPHADVIALLTNLLNYKDEKSSGSRVAEHAAWALTCVATAPENQRKIAQCPNTIESLVRLIGESSSSEELKHQIATAIASLAEEHENRAAVAGALDGLASLLDSDENLIDKECRPLKWGAAKALTLIDIEKGRSLILQSSFAWGGRADALLRLGMYEEALQDLDQSHRLDSESGTTCSFRSFVKTMMDDCESALPDANRAVELEPDYLFRWSERGILRRIMGDLEGALQDLNRAIEMDYDRKDHYSNFKHRAYTKFLTGDEVGARADADWALKDDVPEWVSYDRLPSMLGCLPVEFLGYDLK